ncbi:MAG TPA: hypothetical protein VJ739_15280 [Gemmataceae bacterium]|nr:hypothetical protein [Gemmataceae bacterium]
MSRRSIKARAQELLALGRQLAATPGLTWVEANNEVYGPGRPFARLFSSARDRAAFAKTEESRQLDQLIDGLTDPRSSRSGGNTAASSTCACPSRCTPPWPAKPRQGVSLNQLVVPKLALHLQAR